MQISNRNHQTPAQQRWNNSAKSEQAAADPSFSQTSREPGSPVAAGGLWVGDTPVRTLNISDGTKISQSEIDRLNAVLNGTSEAALPPVHDMTQDIYATLEKNGTAIATLYKDGCMSTPNSMALPDDLAMTGSGTQLAEERLAQMLKFYGGTAIYRSQSGSPA